MSRWRIVSTPGAEADIESAFAWYEGERAGLGVGFIEELRAAYNRVLQGPLKYEELRSGVRRALTRRFPYGIFFYVDGDLIVVLAVLHTSRDPAEWQSRI